MAAIGSRCSPRRNPSRWVALLATGISTACARTSRLLPGQRQEVDLELQGAVVVAGTVVAMDNSPLAGVQLGLAKPRSSPGEEPEFVGSLTSTRDNGEFRFHGNRPPGRYELLALTQRGPVSLLDGPDD